MDKFDLVLGLIDLAVDVALAFDAKPLEEPQAAIDAAEVQALPMPPPAADQHLAKRD